MKIIKKLTFATIILATFILTGCGTPKVKEDTQVQKDLVGATAQLDVNGQTEARGYATEKITSVENIKVTKRETKDKTDIVYATAKLGIENTITVIGNFAITYSQQNNAWVLDSVKSSSTVQVLQPKEKITEEELSKILQSTPEDTIKITKTEIQERKTSNGDMQKNYLLVHAHLTKKDKVKTQEFDMLYTLAAEVANDEKKTCELQKLDSKIEKSYNPEFSVKFSKTADDIKQDFVGSTKISSGELVIDSPNDIAGITIIKGPTETKDNSGGVDGYVFKCVLKLSDSYDFKKSPYWGGYLTRTYNNVSVYYQSKDIKDGKWTPSMVIVEEN